MVNCEADAALAKFWASLPPGHETTEQELQEVAGGDYHSSYHFMTERENAGEAERRAFGVVVKVGRGCAVCDHRQSVIERLRREKSELVDAMTNGGIPAVANVMMRHLNETLDRRGAPLFNVQVDPSLKEGEWYLENEHGRVAGFVSPDVQEGDAP